MTRIDDPLHDREAGSADATHDTTCVDDVRIARVFWRAAEKMGARVLGMNMYKFGHDSPPGCTVLLLLDESHISSHSYAAKGRMAIDLFFSRPPSVCEPALQLIIDELELKNAKWKSIERFT